MEITIIFSLLLLLNAAFDESLIADNIYIDHLKSTIVWGLIYLTFAALIYFFGCENEGYILRLCALWLPVRWIGHDLILNLFRGKEWDYLGSGEKASYLDKLIAKLPFHFIWLKIGLLGVFVLGVILV